MLNKIDGKAIANEDLENLKTYIEHNNYKPCLAIISIGYNDASEVYIKNKIKAAEKVGIEVKHIQLKQHTFNVINEIIYHFNTDPNVHGIIVQLPIPEDLDKEKIINLINPLKDVDGLTYINQAKLFVNSKEKYLVPCTASGIVTLLENTTKIQGKSVAIINRSLLIGKPLAALLTNMNATVTLCHSKSDLSKIKDADIIVSGIGKAHYFSTLDFRNDIIIIDASMNRDESGKLCGDFKIEDNFKGYYTPVPGGVGPMTVMELMYNVVYAYEMQKGVEYNNG